MSRNNKSILPSPDQTRLVTITAHVDHGKTTLADSLCEHNGIISERLAGTVRYLDSMEEEQRRGITIRSSAIGLKHVYRPVKKMNGTGTVKNSNSIGGNADMNNNYVVHLIDSPGHVDFSAEVSSALQICDGTLLVVDVVEGMCARTHSILREAYSQKLVPVLVLNKIDRLCTDLGLSLNQAYVRLRSIIENVNAAASAIIRNARAQAMDVEYDKSKHKARARAGAGGNIEKNEDWQQQQQQQQQQEDDLQIKQSQEEEEETLELEEELWTFNPSKGNVVFTTALYGWGFTIPSLARSLFKSKIISNIKPPIMRQYLFHDVRYDVASGKIFKWKIGDIDDDDKVTMFGEYALKPLWDIMMGVSTAATCVGIESVIFNSAGGNGHGQHDYDFGTGTGSGSGSANEGHGNKNGNTDNAKMKASTVGMNDMVLSSLQIGATTSPEANAALKCPTTEEELQSLLNKTNASSEDAILRTILRRHRPLSDAVLDSVCDVCPSPRTASSDVRKDVLSLVKRSVPVGEEKDSEEDEEMEREAKKEYERIRSAVEQCTSSHPASDVPAVGHCCKFISTDRSHVNDPELFAHLDAMAQLGQSQSVEDLAAEEDSPTHPSIILGVVRVLCGTLTSHNAYYCFGPKYDGSSVESVPKKEVRLYLLMGSSYIRVNQVPAGHICAVFGLEELQLKSVTLSSSKYGMPLNAFHQGIRPLVKVNVEAVSATDTSALERGLARLSLADAAVEVTATSKGERILACLGEIHLEHSILDLKNVYIGKEMDLRVSKPIVDFGESTTWFDNELEDFEQFCQQKSQPLRQTLMPPYCYEDGIAQARNGRSRTIISGRGAAMHVRVVPLSPAVHKALLSKTVIDGSEDGLQEMAKALNLKTESAEKTMERMMGLISTIDSKGNAIMESPEVSNGTCVRVMMATKKNKEVYIPPTLQKGSKEDNVDCKEDEKIETVEVDALAKEVYEDIKKNICGEKRDVYNDDEEFIRRHQYALKVWKTDLRGSVNGGFQSGCAFGPICEEPIRGILVVLEGIEIALHERRKKSGTDGDFFLTRPASGGMVAAALKTGIRSALLSRPARLMEGHLRLTLHSSLTGLGPLYAILSKRRGKVLSDTMVEGTDLISIVATIPQSESFGLTPELMEKSSGDVTAPELVFSHWEMLEEDPFWIPTSLEEREDYGEILLSGDNSTGVLNNALKYIRMLRDRKGLLSDSHKIVVAAEKQRTLARKK